MKIATKITKKIKILRRVGSYNGQVALVREKNIDFRDISCIFHLFLLRILHLPVDFKGNYSVG